MLAVLQAFAVIAVVVAVGGVVGRTGVLGENARMVLNRTAFHIGVPALMLLNLSEAHPGQVLSRTTVISALTAFIMFGLFLAIAKWVLHRSVGEATIGASAASMVNAGNLGLPLSAYVFGGTTEVSAIILFQYILLVPLSLALLDSESGERRSVLHRVKALITTPIIAASAVGIALAAADIELPTGLRDPLELMSALAIPAVLLGFGISLSARDDRPSPSPRTDLALALVLKSLVMPLVAYALARFCFAADDHVVLLVTVLAALPSAQNINTYAAVYQRGEGLARDATLVSTVLSIGVITGIVAVIG